MGTAEQVGQYKRLQPFVEIMDSTLRDGEQTSGVSFLPHEKLIIARMLLGDLNVDRIEVASAKVSEGEKEAVSMICRYAAKVDMLDRVEVLGFIDGGQSIDWIDSCGGKTVNLLAKGSLRHCQEQFEINGYKKHCLMNGLDDIDFLVENQSKTEAWEQRNK